jgi:hypothetical protein
LSSGSTRRIELNRLWRNHRTAGRKVLADQRQGWERFVAAINRIVQVRHA